MEPRAEDSELQTRTMRKVAVRLMPILLGLYIIAYLDRVNVTFAQDSLESDLGFSGAVYGFGAGVFFIAYFFLEVPSNLALHRFGARKWIARIMVTWGIVSACTLFVTGPLGFYAVRFLLGMAEAGFFPGMILYLSYWFPARERARAVGFFMSAIAISYAIGAPLSGAHHVDLRRHRRAEGLAVAVPDRGDPGRPRRRLRAGATWTTGRRRRAGCRRDEKRWLAERLEGEEAARTQRERHSIGDALKDRRVLVVRPSVLLHGRQRLRDLVLGRRDRRPGRRPQRRRQGLRDRDPVHGRDRRPRAHLAPLRPHRRAQAATWRSRWRIAAVAFALSTVVSPVAAIAALAVGLFFLLGAHPVFWTMPAALLSGTAAAAGIALVNSIGNLGGFVGPYLVGLMKDATGSTDGGLVTLAAILAHRRGPGHARRPRPGGRACAAARRAIASPASRGSPRPSACARSCDHARVTTIDASVLVVGGGAIGGITAAKLAGEVGRVVVLDADERHVARLRDPGLTYRGGRRRAHRRARRGRLGRPSSTASSTSRWSPSSRPSTAPRSSRWRRRPGIDAFVSLGNGLIQDRMAELVGADRLLSCIVEWGGTNLGPGRVVRDTIAPMVVGELDGSERPRTQLLARCLQAVGDVRLTRNVRGQIWSKLLVNSAFTGLSAVSGLRYGEVARAPRRARGRLRDLGRGLRGRLGRGA